MEYKKIHFFKMSVAVTNQSEEILYICLAILRLRTFSGKSETKTMISPNFCSCHKGGTFHSHLNITVIHLVTYYNHFSLEFKLLWSFLESLDLERNKTPATQH